MASRGRLKSPLALLAAAALAFRVFNALFLVSRDVPDEYYQSLEVAYRLVFGEGQLSWEWSPAHRLRSFLYPLFFVPCFYALKALNLASTSALVLVPRLQQAVVAALADVYTYRLARLVCGDSTAYWALIFSFSSWFNFFYLTRTVVNSVEVALFTAGLYHWAAYFTKRKLSSLWSSCALFGLACTLRVTCALPILSVISATPAKYAVSLRDARRAIVALLVTATSCILIGGVLIDSVAMRMLHGLDKATYAWSHWEFVRFNLLSNQAAQFGVRPAHWYFSAVVPSMAGPLSVFLPNILASARKQNVILGIPVIVTLIALSVLAHKEFRFALVIWPLLIIVLANHVSGAANRGISRKCLLAFVFIVNLGLMYLSSKIYQVSVIQASAWIRQQSVMRADNNAAPAQLLTVVSLLDCYRMPGHSHLGPRVRLRQLSCDPAFSNLHGVSPSSQHAFRKDIVHSMRDEKWFATRFQLSREPDFIVIADNRDYKLLRDAGLLATYTECAGGVFPIYLRYSKRNIITIQDPVLILCRKTRGRVEK